MLSCTRKPCHFHLEKVKEKTILHETLQWSSAQLLQRQGCDLTQCHCAPTDEKLLLCAFSITVFLWTTTALWCDEKGAVSWKSIWCFGTNWQPSLGFLLLPLGEGPFNLLLCFAPFFSYFGFVLLVMSEAMFTRITILSFSLQVELTSVKAGAVINTETQITWANKQIPVCHCRSVAFRAVTWTHGERGSSLTWMGPFQACILFLQGWHTCFERWALKLSPDCDPIFEAS